MASAVVLPFLPSIAILSNRKLFLYGVLYLYDAVTAISAIRCWKYIALKHSYRIDPSCCRLNSKFNSYNVALCSKEIRGVVMFVMVMLSVSKPKLLV